MSSNPYPLAAERDTGDWADANAPQTKSLASPVAVRVARHPLDETAPTIAAGVAINSSRPTVRLSHMLLMADLAALGFTAALAQGGSPQSPGELTVTGLVALAVLLLGARLSGLHDRDDRLPRRTTLDEAPRIFQLSTLCALTAWLTTTILGYKTLAAVNVLTLWLGLTLLLILARTIARLSERHVSPAERCVFIGDASTEQAFCLKLHNHAEINSQVVARVDLEELDSWRADEDLMSRVADVRHLKQTLGIQRAILAPDRLGADRALELVQVLQSAGIPTSVLPGRLDALGPSIEVTDVDGMTIAGIRQFEPSRTSAFFKRTFDLVASSIALTIMSPAMIAIAIAIKLDTRGPVFFRQLRVGRHGVPFEMLKFRTMVRDAETLKDSLADSNQALPGLFKIRGDPRITRVGRFLRQSSLDELPQLLNVLRGEMSLVGPRPLIPDEDRYIHGWQRRRLDLLPGITGPWQVLGPVRVSLHEMVNIDSRYLLNRSMWTDVTILLRTAQHVLARRGL